MPEDIRKTEDRPGPKTGSGDGAAYGKGYGSGGLGQGADRAGQDLHAEPNSWDAPGVTPDGHRTGSTLDGPRIAHDGEGEHDPDRLAADEER
jgi:hypothetical protein